MNNIIDLNGVEYVVVKKDYINDLKEEKKQAEKHLKLIKDIVGKSFEDVMALIENGKLEVKKDATLKKTPTKKSTDKFTVCESSRKLLSIKMMDEKGAFYSKNNSKLGFDIRDVLQIKQELDKGMTVADAKVLRKKLDLTYYYFNLIVYNLEYNIFDKYIKDFYAEQKPKVGHMKMPVQNNPEKRKESGYYGI